LWSQSSDPNRKTLDFSISDPALAAWITVLDKRNVDEAHRHTEEWFHKKFSRETIENLHKAALTPPSQEGYDALFKCRVTSKTKVYVYSVDDDGEESYSEGTQADLKAGATAMPIIDSSGLWFMSTQFGMGGNWETKAPQRG
jgi:hypothetical protein